MPALPVTVCCSKCCNVCMVCFSECCNARCVAVSVAMYARYRQVGEYLPASMTHSVRLNKASLTLGLLSTLGVSIVGNFQVCYLLGLITIKNNLIVNFLKIND